MEKEILEILKAIQLDITGIKDEQHESFTRQLPLRGEDLKKVPSSEGAFCIRGKNFA